MEFDPESWRYYSLQFLLEGAIQIAQPGYSFYSHKQARSVAECSVSVNCIHDNSMYNDFLVGC